MRVKIYVIGPSLYSEDRATGQGVFEGRSTASIRDPFQHHEEIPVFLKGEQVGRAFSMQKHKFGNDPYLCFEASVEFNDLSKRLRGQFDGLFGEAKGCMWTKGIFITELHLKFGKNKPRKRSTQWVKQSSISSIIASLPCWKKALSPGVRPGTARSVRQEI